MSTINITKEKLEEVLNRLGYHPATDETKELHSDIRQGFLYMSLVVLEVVPPGREQALALTALQEAMMWANAGIACNLAPVDISELGADIQELLDELTDK